jgi:membrane-associated phospholipid phosphatase
MDRTELHANERPGRRYCLPHTAEIPCSRRSRHEQWWIVSFPSFHVVLAILSAFALSSIRSLRAPVWVLAVLICISAVSTGWHYGIDVFGGVIVAIASISAVSLIALSPKSIKHQRS